MYYQLYKYIKSITCDAILSKVAKQSCRVDIARQQIWASDELRILLKLYEGHNVSSLIFMSSEADRKQSATGSSSWKHLPSQSCPRGIRDTTCGHSDCPNKVRLPRSTLSVHPLTSVQYWIIPVNIQGLRTEWEIRKGWHDRLWKWGSGCALQLCVCQCLTYECYLLPSRNKDAIQSMSDSFDDVWWERAAIPGQGRRNIAIRTIRDLERETARLICLSLGPTFAYRWDTSQRNESLLITRISKKTWSQKENRDDSIFKIEIYKCWVSRSLLTQSCTSSAHSLKKICA